MNLYLIRHSISERNSFNKKDVDRELTKEGELLINNSANTWKNFIDNFDIILTSPLKRARQTSELISSVMQTTKNILVENNLAPGSRTSDLIDILKEMDLNHIAVVGHQPDISIHISNLCGKEGFNLVFSESTIAKIEFAKQIRYNSGKLIFLIPPTIKLEKGAHSYTN
jgi:phosphohistidine phosphatase